MGRLPSSWLAEIATIVNQLLGVSDQFVTSSVTGKQVSQNLERVINSASEALHSREFTPF